MSIHLNPTGLMTLRGKLAKAVVGVPQEVRAVNREYVPIMLSTLIRHSSGRPGPEVVTGAYNAAYVVELNDDGMGVHGSNPSPQSQRLEYGFIGEDSLGRMYDQPPLPHFRPTLEELAPRYAQSIGNAFPKWWYTH